MRVRPSPRVLVFGLISIFDLLTTETYLAGTLHPAEDVVNGLTADADELPAYDFRNKVSRDVGNFLQGGTIETITKNGSHGAGQRLHLHSKRHVEGDFSRRIEFQVDPHRVRAFLIFPHIFQIVGDVVTGCMGRSLVGVKDQVFSFLFFRKPFKKTK